MTATLRVLCWDHPRCTGPMAAAADAYSAVRPDVSVLLTTRPLAQFNDQPAWEVDGTHDLIFIDHPMIGSTAQNQAVVPIDTVLPAATLERIEGETIGAAHRSYSWGGHQWALGVDATSQVAAVHEDRMRALAAEIPRSWDDVLTLAATAPGSVALPLYPSDAMCTLISLSANAALAAGAEPHWLRTEAVEMLSELATLVDDDCFARNPPRLFEAMGAESPIAYVPFVFGYATLARAPLSFTDVPGVDGLPRGAVLGGAGLAVFATSPHVGEAVGFAEWCMRADVQRDILVPAGAQPGNRLVWDDDVNGTTTAYLHSTRRSLEHAYMRPRGPWWPEFQRQAGEALTRLLRDHAGPGRIMRELELLAEQHQDAGDRVEART